MTTDKKEFLFLLGSARAGGNTEFLARHAARSLPEDVSQVWLHLADHMLPTFEDIRHHETRKYEVTTDSENILLNATLQATDLVIASPVYWYNVSATTKHYLDHWSAWMRLDEVDFKKRMAGKNMWAVTAFSDDDPAGAQPLVDCLRLSAEYMKMHWSGALYGYGNRPGDVLNHPESLNRAAAFFESSREAAVRE